MRALETTDRFKIISTPSVYTANNKLAIIATGSQVPVPSSTTSGFTGTTPNNGLTTTSSITYEDVLLATRHHSADQRQHEVTLQIRQTNNTLGANVNISGNEVPIINTQEINTEITVPTNRPSSSAASSTTRPRATPAASRGSATSPCSVISSATPTRTRNGMN